MNIGQMKYRELVKKVPADMEVELEGKGGNVVIRMMKTFAPKTGIRRIPAMF